MLEKLAIIDMAGTVLEPEPKRCSQDERHALERCMQIEATDASPRMIHWPADRRLKQSATGRGSWWRTIWPSLGAVGQRACREGKLDQSQIDALIAGVTSSSRCTVTVSTPKPAPALIMIAATNLVGVGLRTLSSNFTGSAVGNLSIVERQRSVSVRSIDKRRC